MYMRPYGAPTICGLAGAPTPDFAAFAGVGQSPSSTSLRSERGPSMCLRVFEIEALDISAGGNVIGLE